VCDLLQVGRGEVPGKRVAAISRLRGALLREVNWKQLSKQTEGEKRWNEMDVNVICELIYLCQDSVLIT
jgi:hypothetical protein